MSNWRGPKRGQEQTCFGPRRRSLDRFCCCTRAETSAEWIRAPTESSAVKKNEGLPARRTRGPRTLLSDGAVQKVVEMTTRRLEFFAVSPDLQELLFSIEATHRLQYVEAGLCDRQEVVPRESLADIPGLGIANHGDTNQETVFLVANRESVIHVRTVAQRKRGAKFAIDQVANPHTIVFRPGGRYAGSSVIAGQVGTTSGTAESKELFEVFAAEIRHRFEKVRSFYVGKGAGALLDSGCRLTASIKAPPVYDLNR